MHRSEEERWSTCVACGSPVVPAVDRCFRFGERGVLCFVCSVERGGSYDEVQDRWQSEPRLDELSRFAN